MPLSLYCLHASLCCAPLWHQWWHRLKMRLRRGKNCLHFRCSSGTFIFYSQVITRNSAQFQTHAAAENHRFQSHGLKVTDVMGGTETPPGKRPEPQIPLGHTLMQICTFKWTGDFAGAQWLWLVGERGWGNSQRGEGWIKLLRRW